MLGGPQNSAGRIMEEVNFLILPENETRPLCYSAPDRLLYRRRNATYPSQFCAREMYETECVSLKEGNS